MWLSLLLYSSVQAQLFPGWVGLVDPATQAEVGTIFVSGEFPHLQETWFMPAASDPGAPFAFVHHGDVPSVGKALALLEESDPDWEVHPCFRMDAEYVGLPDPAVIAQLEGAPGVDRYAFVLVQANEIVGRLLREHQVVTGASETFLDHWVFYTSYDPPTDPDDIVWVVPTGNQFATTAAFYADVAASLPEAGIAGFAQIPYEPLLGSQCAAGFE